MKRALPPTYFFAAIVLAALLHLALPVRRLINSPWRLLGLLPIALGAALNLAADAAFKRRGTTVKPFQESTSLVTEGVFRLTRNPMYLGMALIVLGVAILLGSLSPLAVALVFAVLLDRVFVTAEERMLESAFGDELRRYRKTTRRWL